jgi:predicted DNA-binding antitoxin AbrB/MazE fold protein
MNQTIRAIYEHGVLRPLDPLDLSEGETVQVSVRTENFTRDAFRAAMGDLLMPRVEPVLSDEEMERLEEQLRSLTAGVPPVSDIIIEEREQGW